jgi:2-(1,2-epoxy-1,2-dihydrophenyl)acetyl-CoA isomerase
MNDSVLMTKEGEIATITLNRPQVMNTYALAMSERLLDISESLLNDKSTRVVILRGAGPVFMAGGDINYFKDNLDLMPEGVRSIIRTLSATIHNFRSMHQTVIGAVHGAAAGAGLSLMLACDLVVAMTGTKFTTAYSALGVSPDGGLSYFLPKLLGTKKAMELLLLSEQFNVEEAKEWGLINKVVPKSEFEAVVSSLARQCMAMPKQSMENIKRLTYLSETQSLSSQLESEAGSFTALTETADFRDRVLAFLKK